MQIALMSRGHCWHINSFLIPLELIIRGAAYEADRGFGDVVYILTCVFSAEAWLAG